MSLNIIKSTLNKDDNLKFLSNSFSLLKQHSQYLVIKKSHTNLLFLIFITFILSVFITSCGEKKNTLEFSFQLNKIEAFTSSDQMVVWLEKTDKTFVKTLFVCDYLAYGGYVLTSICPSWSGREDWKVVEKEEFDAVTGATPTQGTVKFEFEFEKQDIPNGEYNIFIEVHLAEDYNELYSGTVNFSDTKCNTELKVKYIPTKHPETLEAHLSNVKVICNQ